MTTEVTHYSAVDEVSAQLQLINDASGPSLPSYAAFLNAVRRPSSDFHNISHRASAVVAIAVVAVFAAAAGLTRTATGNAILQAGQNLYERAVGVKSAPAPAVKHAMPSYLKR